MSEGRGMVGKGGGGALEDEAGGWGAVLLAVAFSNPRCSLFEITTAIVVVPLCLNAWALGWEVEGAVQGVTPLL